MKKIFLCLMLCAAPFLSEAASQKKITILYTGDTYGVWGGNPAFPGGLAPRKSAFEKIRKENPNLVILDAGNALAPHYYSRMDQGELSFQVLGEMRYDALNLGSHDLDYGREHLLTLRAGAEGMKLLSSNIYDKATGKPWADEFIVKEVAGIKIGILGVCDPKAEQEVLLGGLSGLDVLDPEKILASVIPRVRPHVQILILLSNIPPQNLKAMLEKTEHIDIAISRSAGGQTDYDDHTSPTAYDFHYFMRASSSAPLQIRTLLAYAGRFGFEAGRIDVTLDGSQIKRMEPSVVDMPIRAEEDEGLAQRVGAKKKAIDQEYWTVLLDRLQERLGKPWNEVSFVHMVLVMMREASSAEIAVINENFFYKPQIIHEQIRKRDYLVAWDIQRLFWTNNHLVKVNLLGTQIRKLVDENKEENVALRFLGLKAGDRGTILINGRPLKDQEFYSIATSNYLVFGATPWPTLSQGKCPKEIFGGKRVVLRDLTTRRLEEDLRRQITLEAWMNRYQTERENPYPSQWSLWLDRLSVSASNLETHNKDSFAGIRDARVKALDQVAVGTSGNIWLTLDHSLLFWKNGVEVGYSQVRLPDKVVNNPMDSLIFRSQIQGQKLRMPIGGPRYANPNLGVAYDTEFSPTLGNPRRKLLRLEPGLATTLNGLFYEIRLSGVAELDYSLPQVNREYGASFSSRFLRPWRELFTFGSDIEFFYFFPSALDTLDDLLWQGSFRHRLNIPVWGALALSPYLDVFAWRGKLTNETGWNYLVGINLSYSQLWKVWPGRSYR